MLMRRTNEEWTAAIHDKVASVLNDDAERFLPSNPILSADDPRLPHAIDHTLLTPDATSAQIDRLCKEAVECRFKVCLFSFFLSVFSDLCQACCVNGANVAQVFKHMADCNSNTLVCCVVGFPLGASAIKAKSYEATQAIADGAREIDMVINLGALKSSDFATVYLDIDSVVQACHPYPVKVIIETSFLTTEEKITACFIAAEAGAAWVKTCSGFSGKAGATVEDVGLMHRSVRYMQGRVRVKASGGIRSFEQAQELLAAGADRLGT